LASLSDAYRQLTTSEFDGALRSSAAAVARAETAFFDRDMLAMLYYPDEHNLAVRSCVVFCVYII
jgi:hypothetical protein